jgi:hypothetical protein
MIRPITRPAPRPSWSTSAPFWPRFGHSAVIDPRSTASRGPSRHTGIAHRRQWPLCADDNGLAWMKSIGAKQDPPNKVGFIYMLAGDTGTNNSAAGLTEHQHWVQTGPHVMIVGPAVKEMPGYSRAVDVKDPHNPTLCTQARHTNI